MKRIVIIDKHIVAQFHAVGWWTMCKSNTNTEEDFALWPESEPNLRKAKALAGEQAPVVHSGLTPLARDGGWCVDDDIKPKSYNEALRELARRA